MAKRLREANPELVSVGVDPVGSILARPESLNELKEGDSPIYKVRVCDCVTPCLRRLS